MTRDQDNAIQALHINALQVKFVAESLVSHASDLDNERLPPPDRFKMLILLRNDIPSLERLLNKIKQADTKLGPVHESMFDV